MLGSKGLFWVLPTCLSSLPYFCGWVVKAHFHSSPPQTRVCITIDTLIWIRIVFVSTLITFFLKANLTAVTSQAIGRISNWPSDKIMLFTNRSKSMCWFLPVLCPDSSLLSWISFWLRLPMVETVMHHFLRRAFSPLSPADNGKRKNKTGWRCYRWRLPSSLTLCEALRIHGSHHKPPYS